MIYSSSLSFLQIYEIISPDLLLLYFLVEFCVDEHGQPKPTPARYSATSLIPYNLRTQHSIPDKVRPDPHQSRTADISMCTVDLYQ